MVRVRWITDQSKVGGPMKIRYQLCVVCVLATQRTTLYFEFLQKFHRREAVFWVAKSFNERPILPENLHSQGYTSYELIRGEYSTIA